MPRVNFHVHSSLSDGELAPEELAEYLASRGVAFAALTDHDGVEGSPRFRHAAARRGMACVEGMEITASSSRGEVHLLAFWTDPELSPRIAPGGGAGKARAGLPPAAQAVRAARAGGAAVFLAHPYSVSRDPAVLGALVDELAAAGLDGIEARYAKYSLQEQDSLAAMAAVRSLAVCAGTDLHEPGASGQPAAIEMDDEEWRAFRDLLVRRSRPGAALVPEIPETRPRPRHGPRAFVARIALPALAAVALFVAALFALILPRFGSMLLDRKKETIKEIAESASSVLAEYAQDALLGRSDLEQAQREAAARIRDIRYGREGKDYLWITDMTPRMVMHPYRPELEGTDLSGYADEHGVLIFMEFVKAVEAGDEGYVEYLWQWKDEVGRIVPKLSFVRAFRPWGWIIGTGVYLDDVHAEIAELTRSLVLVSAGTAAFLALILMFIVQQSLSIERARVAAEGAVRESRERYRALAEASSEGTVIVIDGACTFANPSFLEMTGYSSAELPLLAVNEVFRLYPDGSEELRLFFAALAAGRTAAEGAAEPAVPPAFECALVGKRGETVEALVAATRLRLGGRDGYVFAARETMARSARLAPREALAAAGAEGNEPEGGGARFGRFRAQWNRRAAFLDADAAARRILGLDAADGAPGLFSALSDRLFADELYRSLASDRAALGARTRVARRGPPGSGTLEIAISVFVVGDEGEGESLYGVVEDLTERFREERMRDERLAALETDSLRLQEPAASLASAPPTCPASAGIREAAERMRREEAGEALIADSSGSVVGIVTGRDLGERVVAAGLDPSSPVHRVMTAPLVSVPAEATALEAMAAMAEARVGRVALRSRDGSVAGLIRRADLMARRLDSFSAFDQALDGLESVEDMADRRSRLSAGVRSLVAAGARSRFIARIYTAAQDRLTARLVTLAERDLGAPPCAFAFVALGSAGRREQLPFSDQDNAIVYRPSAGDGSSERPYFLELGRRVCRDLERAGSPLCRGGMMALNERWCAPFAAWEGYLREWIAEPEPDRLLGVHSFFDLRSQAGEAGLVDELRSAVFRLIDEGPSFLVHLAAAAREFRIPSPPVRDPSAAKESAALFPAFARAYALKRRIPETGTFDRLERLADAGALPREAAAEYAEAYEDLLALRLSLWAADGDGAAARGGRARLAERREDILAKAALAKAATLQKRLGYDFLGAAM